jgi:hypothetical protein
MLFSKAVFFYLKLFWYVHLHIKPYFVEAFDLENTGTELQSDAKEMEA